MKCCRQKRDCVQHGCRKKPVRRYARLSFCSVASAIVFLSCQSMVTFPESTPPDTSRSVTDIHFRTVYSHYVLYVTNNGSVLGDAGIAEFALTPTGSLTAVGPFATGNEYYASGPSPAAIAISPNGQYLYVANSSETNVSGYTIGPSGALLPLAGSPFSAGSRPGDIAISPDSHHLYVIGTNDNVVTGFSIGATGELTAVAGGPFATGVYPHRLAITPNGNYLYVTNVGDARKGMKIDSNGKLSEDVASEGLGITGYSIGIDGALSPLAGSPFLNGSLSPFGIQISPNGKYLYVTNSLNKSISGYLIGQGGDLTSMSIGPFPTDSEPDDVAITPDGKYLYATSAANRLLAFAINARGELSAITGPVFTGSDPAGIVVSPDGKYLYVTNYGSNTVSAFVIGPDGSLSTIGSAFRSGSLPDGIVAATLY